MDEAVYRLKLAADVGADVCFIEGVKTKELLESTVAALAPKPVLVNVISGGLTPSFTTREAEEMGAKIISQWSIAFKSTPSPTYIYSFLSCFLCRDGTCLPQCNAVVEENRHGFRICSGYGPKGILWGNG